MNKLSSLIGTQIISIFEQKTMGYIIDIIFAKKFEKIKKLVVADTNDEGNKILEVRDIYSVGEDFVLISNKTKLIVSNNEENMQSLMNKQVIDIEGNYKGKITDIEFDEKWNINNLKTEATNIKYNEILGVGEHVILNSANTQKKLCNFAPKNIIKKPNVAIQQNVQIAPVMPMAVRVQPNQLIGKRVKRDFVVLGNQLLARKHTVITSNLILTAKRMNVLKELELIAY